MLAYEAKVFIKLRPVGPGDPKTKLTQSFGSQYNMIWRPCRFREGFIVNRIAALGLVPKCFISAIDMIMEDASLMVS